MRELTIKVYTIDELNKEAQENAIFNTGITSDYSDWSEYICEDAKNIGVKICHFDIQKQDIKIELYDNAFDVCHKILKDYGENCNTSIIAKEWLLDFGALFAKYADANDPDKVDENLTDEFDNDLDDLEALFVEEIGNEYLSLLGKEYDYLSSEECIFESIIANSYEFLSDGSIFTGK